MSCDHQAAYCRRNEVLVRISHCPHLIGHGLGNQFAVDAGTVSVIVAAPLDHFGIGKHRLNVNGLPGAYQQACTARATLINDAQKTVG